MDFGRKAAFAMNPKNNPRRQVRSKKGQTLVEYALVLAFIAVVAISVLIRLGDQVNRIFSSINSQLVTAAHSSH